MPCTGCPERGSCTVICDVLESLLPSMYAGKFAGGSKPSTGVEAVLKLYEDDKEAEEIAYHVHYEVEDIERIIERYRLGRIDLKKLAKR